MINCEKLIKMVRKPQRQAAMRRVERISLPRATAEVDVESYSKASLAEKGHFVIYTFDRKRFVIPLAYLNNDIFQELLKLSEEEFGLSSDEPIRKPQRQAAMRRVERISLPRATAEVDVESYSKASLAEKGHFVIYTFDRKRFVIPLAYLNNDIFQELLKLSEEEFGLSSDEPITLPCDAAFMTCIVSQIKRGAAKGLAKEFLDSIFTRHCTFSAAFPEEQQSFVCSY